MLKTERVRAMNHSNGQSAIGNRQSAIILFPALCCLFLAAASSGCSSAQVIKSDGSARWSGLGVQVKLPEGTWRVRVSEKEQAATFVPEGRRGNLALFRVPVPGSGAGKAAPNPPDWLAFKRLFAYFRDKKEISLGHVALPGGRTVECAEYEVKTDDGATRVQAYALRRGGWIYELAAWDFDNMSGAPESNEEPPGERIMGGLEFTE